MFGISFTEFIVIAAVAFLVVGPKNLVGLAEKMGTWINKTKKTITHYRQTVLNEQVDLSTFFEPKVELNKELNEVSEILEDQKQESKK